MLKTTCSETTSGDFSNQTGAENVNDNFGLAWKKCDTQVLWKFTDLGQRFDQ